MENTPTNPPPVDVPPLEIYEYPYEKYGEHTVAIRMKNGGVELFNAVKLFAQNDRHSEYLRVKDEAAAFAKRFVEQFNRPSTPAPTELLRQHHPGDCHTIKCAPITPPKVGPIASSAVKPPSSPELYAMLREVRNQADQRDVLLRQALEALEEIKEEGCPPLWVSNIDTTITAIRAHLSEGK